MVVVWCLENKGGGGGGLKRLDREYENNESIRLAFLYIFMKNLWRLHRGRLGVFSMETKVKDRPIDL